jgi:hypothetical protein
VVEDGRVLAEGKNLDELRRQLRPRLQATLSEAATGITRTGLRTWDIGTLPRVFSHGEVRAYPALADTGDAVDVRLFETRAQADAAMLRGTRRLLLLQVCARRGWLRHCHRPAHGLEQNRCVRFVGVNVAPHHSHGFTARPVRWRRAVSPGCWRQRGRCWPPVPRIWSRSPGRSARRAGRASLTAAPAPGARRVHRPAGAAARLVHPGFVAETGARRLPTWPLPARDEATGEDGGGTGPGPSGWPWQRVSETNSRLADLSHSAGDPDVVRCAG